MLGIPKQLCCCDSDQLELRYSHNSLCHPLQEYGVRARRCKSSRICLLLPVCMYKHVYNDGGSDDVVDDAQDGVDHDYCGQ